jgi:tetratricopeptide (TPR) repeat protein
MIRRSSWSITVMAMALTLLLPTAVACTTPTQQDQADVYNNRGIAHYKRREYEEAIADCTEAIRLDPNHTKAYGNRGDVYRELGQHEKAIADLDKAIELDPECAEAHAAPGNVY